MALEKVLALDATGVIEKEINTGGGGPVTEFSGDCDTLTTPGDYNATNSATNRPTTDTNGYFVKVFTRAAAPQILQVANPNAEAAVMMGVALEYYRWFDGTVWSLWKTSSGGASLPAWGMLGATVPAAGGTGTDLDTMVTQGYFTIFNPVNAPLGSTLTHHLFVLADSTGGGRSVQIAQVANQPKWYIRNQNSGTWSGWLQLIDSDTLAASIDDGVTAANICDLAMDGTTVINTMRDWYYKPGIGIAKLIAHGKAGASTSGYISKGTSEALTAGTSGAGASVVTALGTFLVTTGTTATGYATAYGGVEFSPPSAIANPYNLAINLSGVGSKLAISAAIDVDALSDATNSYEARLTLLGVGPLTNSAMAATTPGFSISYSHSVNSGNFVIQYRGADGTLKTVNTTVAPGVGLANTKRITLKAHRTAAGAATVTISIGGTVYTITDSAFNASAAYHTTVIGARMLKSAGTTSRSLNVRSSAIARNFE